MNANNLYYRLADIVARYGDVTSYQIGDCMQDAQTLYFAEVHANTTGEVQTLYFGVRATGTVLLYDAPDVLDMMIDFNRACMPHDWFMLQFDPNDGVGWFEPVRVNL